MTIDIKIFRNRNSKGLGMGHMTHVFEGKTRPMCIANVRFVLNAEPEIIVAMPPGFITQADLLAVSQRLVDFHAAVGAAHAEILDRQAKETTR